MMKFSELFSSNESHVYGVSIDGYFSKVPSNLKEIGIVIPSDSEDLDLDTLDVIISLVNHGISTILEVPYDSVISPEALYPTLNSIGVEVCLAPPVEFSNVSLERYIKTLSDFATFILSINYAKSAVQPISGFMNFLVCNEFGYVPLKVTSDAYMASRFDIPIETMDLIKQQLETVIIQALGGATEFKNICHGVALSIIDREAIHAQ